jgi:hypothetical protein
MMAEPCECVGKAAIVETHKAQEGASGGVKSLDWRWNLGGYVKS